MLQQSLKIGLPRGVGHVQIGPLTILRLRQSAAIDLIRSAVLLRQPADIAICNAHTMLTAFDRPAYAEVLQSMTVLNDGIGANIAARALTGSGFPDNLNGTDLVPALLADIGIPLRIYLLGAEEAQLQGAKSAIETAYPMHTVVGTQNGFFDQDETASVCERISAARPDLLLVAMGNPRQELFIHENRGRISATVTMGVGALFDFMSGRVVRAPKMVQNMGLEWLFRFIQEPRRLFRRYIIGIPRFFAIIYRLKRGADI